MCTRHLTLVFLSWAIGSLPGMAQSNKPSMGKLRITVSPKQASVFVDGRAIRDGSQTIDLPAGNHTVDVNGGGGVWSGRTPDRSKALAAQVGSHS